MNNNEVQVSIIQTCVIICIGWGSKDQRYVASFIQAEGTVNKTSPLYNKIDLTQTAVMGHSMGGGASYISSDAEFFTGMCV